MRILLVTKLRIGPQLVTQKIRIGHLLQQTIKTVSNENQGTQTWRISLEKAQIQNDKLLKHRLANNAMDACQYQSKSDLLMYVFLSYIFTVIIKHGSQHSHLQSHRRTKDTIKKHAKPLSKSIQHTSIHPFTQHGKRLRT